MAAKKICECFADDALYHFAAVEAAATYTVHTQFGILIFFFWFFFFLFFFFQLVLTLNGK